MDNPMAFNIVIGSSRPGDHRPLEAALRRKGIQAGVFTDGSAILEAARDMGPDWVLVDLHLTGLNGIEVARSLRDQRTSILVDEEEPGLGDLKRLGLEVLVRPRGGAEGLAEDIEKRLNDANRIVEDVLNLKDARDQKGRLLDIVGGSEEKLLRAALEDPDTHLLSGTYLKAWRVEEEWLRSRMTSAPLSMLVMGLQGKYTELARQHGVDALREVEQRLAGLLLTELSGSDLPAREEPGKFLVLMPGTTAKEAGRRAFSVRGEFSDIQFQGREGTFPMALAMGLAAVPHRHLHSAGELLGRADEAFACAQRIGQGKVCLWQGVQELNEEDFLV